MRGKPTAVSPSSVPETGPSSEFRFPYQRHPGQPFLGKDIFVWRIILWVIEASRRDINFSRAVVPLIRQRSAAIVTKSPPRTRVRPISLGSSLLEFEFGALHGNPRNGLRAGGAAAILAMAIRLIDRLLRRLEPNSPAVTTASNGCSFHSPKVI